MSVQSLYTWQNVFQSLSCHQLWADNFYNSQLRANDFSDNKLGVDNFYYNKLYVNNFCDNKLGEENFCNISKLCANHKV